MKTTIKLTVLDFIDRLFTPRGQLTSKEIRSHALSSGEYRWLKHTEIVKSTDFVFPPLEEAACRAVEWHGAIVRSHEARSWARRLERVSPTVTRDAT